MTASPSARPPRSTEKLIAAATNLKVIGRAGIGVDNVDIPAATRRGIIVMNTPFGNSITTAEHAIALMFALARQIPEADASTQAGKWEKNRFMGVEITGKTLGVIGCGNIGSIVADRARRPEDACHRLRSVPVAGARASSSASRRSSSTSCLRRADFITLHTPLTDKTRNIIDAEAIAKMKKGVRIINCARGGLVDEAALRAALEVRQGRRAPPSTCSSSEPATENPLFGHPNVVCTPHLGASTTEAQENVALQIAEQMSDYLIKGAVSNALNMPSITAEEAPRLKPFVELAEVLGAFVGQVTEAPIKGIGIVYEGAVAEHEHPRADLGGAWPACSGPFLQDVNMVSAPIMAKERGIIGRGGQARQRGARYESYIRSPSTPRTCRATPAAPCSGRQAAHHPDQGHQPRRRVRAAHALCHQRRQAGLHRPLRHAARRGRRQHRHLPARPRQAGRRRHLLRVASTSRSRDELLRQIEEIPQVKRARAVRF